MPTLEILYHPVKSTALRLCYIFVELLVIWVLMTLTSITTYCQVYSLLVSPYHWRQLLLVSLYMKNLSWYPTRSFIPIGQCSWCWKVLLTIPEKQSNHHYHLATNSWTYNSDLPVSYTSAMMTWTLWLQPITSLDLRRRNSSLALLKHSLIWG